MKRLVDYLKNENSKFNYDEKTGELSQDLVMIKSDKTLVTYIRFIVQSAPDNEGGWDYTFRAYPETQKSKEAEEYEPVTLDDWLAAGYGVVLEKKMQVVPLDDKCMTMLTPMDTTIRGVMKADGLPSVMNEILRVMKYLMLKNKDKTEEFKRENKRLLLLAPMVE